MIIKLYFKKNILYTYKILIIVLHKYYISKNCIIFNYIYHNYFTLNIILSFTNNLLKYS